MASMMDEMAKTLARRRAQAEKKEVNCLSLSLSCIQDKMYAYVFFHCAILARSRTGSKTASLGKVKYFATQTGFVIIEYELQCLFQQYIEQW